MIRRISLFFILLTVLACNQEDDQNPTDTSEDPTPTPNLQKDVVVYAEIEPIGDTFRYAIAKDTYAVTSVNLDQEFDVDFNDYKGVYENRFGFFFKPTGTSMIAWKDHLTTGEFTSFQDFCETEGSLVNSMVGSDTKVTNFHVLNASSNGLEGMEVTINSYTGDCGILILPEYFYFKGGIINEGYLYALFTKQSFDGLYLSKINLTTYELEHTLVFQEDRRLYFHEGKLYTYTYEEQVIYHATNFQLLESGPNPFPMLATGTGFLDPQISGNQILLNRYEMQPNPNSGWPMVLDRDNGSILSGEFLGFTVNENLQALEGYESVSVGASAGNLSTGLAVFGFTDSMDHSGIVYTNMEGDLLKVVDLPAVPKELFILD